MASTSTPGARRSAGRRAKQVSAPNPPAEESSNRIPLYRDETVAAIGTAVRRLRLERRMTLQKLAGRTGLSASMLSMVERARTAPSIGTLVTVASALDVHMSELFAPQEGRASSTPVARLADQPVYETAAGVTRRLACNDDARGFEFAVNEYEPGTASSITPVRHGGTEYGTVIQGRLTIEVGMRSHDLGEGDSIAYDSGQPHRIINNGTRRARAVWLNFDR